MHLPRCFGRPLHRFDVVASTNDEAARLAEEGAPEGAVVVAQAQSRGRGRLDRRWESPRGGLWMSLILRPTVPPSALPGLTLVMAHAVVRALREAFGVEAAVRWPNDVYVGDRKLAGLLAEARCGMETVQACCIGLGLNVNVEPSTLPEEIRETATSLLALVGRTLDLGEVLDVVLGAMEEDYQTFQRGGFEALRPTVAEHCATLGRCVEVEREGAPTLHGLARDLGPGGCLVVEGPGGLEEIWTCERVRIAQVPSVFRTTRDCES